MVGVVAGLLSPTPLTEQDDTMSRSARMTLTPAERAERKAARVPAAVKRRARRTATRQAFIAAHLAERI